LSRYGREYDIGGLLSSHFGALGAILILQLLHRFPIDPAVSSGAFVTTVTDVAGDSSFLGIATLWFGLG
jgi:magnesium transporter